MPKKYVDPEILKSRFMNGCDDYLPLWKIEMVIDDAPAADVEEVRHGEWETDFCDYVCSVCGGHISDCTLDDYSEPNYCPFCGAKMDGKGKTDGET